MENIDQSIHTTAIKLAEELKNQAAYKSFYQDVQKLVSTSSIRKDEFKESLQQAMKEKGLDTKLRNAVYHWIRNQNLQALKLDPITALTKAGNQWEKRIHKSLNSMSNDLETPLARYRSISDQQELTEKWNELSTYTIDLSKFRPVYAPKDFLDVLLTLSGYVPYNKVNEPKWEFAHLPIQVKSLEELRKLYIEWSRGDPLLGVNPMMPSTIPGFPNLETERISLGERVLLMGYAPVAQEYLKKGAPQCLRAQIWSKVLGTEINVETIDLFLKLKNNFLEMDLMIDKLVFKDVQLTASNDDQYFVFEDLLYQVMLCFSRDTEIIEFLKESLGNPMTTTIKSKSTVLDKITFPPSGVIPFHGFTMYATPFCYLYDDAIQLYFTFKAFYIRYWHRLHFISTHPQGIVSLCLLYERLLEANEPLLWIHFRNIGVNPVRIVFKWLMRAFSGHLAPEQLLLLWDAILGYDSLEVLPLLAIAILSYRKENLFQVNTLQSIEAILADLSTISVIPLLQLALMK